MQRSRSSRNRMLALVASAGVALAAPALGEKPSWAGSGKPDKQEDKRGGHKSDKREGGEHGDHGKHGDRASSTVRFEDRQRVVIRDYYAREFHAGHCPPGLAKKRNGCMPPGQAKKWVLGRPLPHDVIYYDLPPAIVVEIGVPPPGYRYVRVATDILLIAIGTGMVVDGILDLGRY
jgi:Ni/Co efflux regulator RcnB